ncbi:MAG: glycosidase [Dehalococcoidia bacterium]
MPATPANHNNKQVKVLEEAEAIFTKELKGPLVQAMQIGERDIVVGIPFYNETDSVAHVVETARQGLRKFYPDSKSMIVAAGSPAGTEALKAINSLPPDSKIPTISFLLNDDQLTGKGWEVRAIAEIAGILSADLIVLEADLKSRDKSGRTEGLTPDWIPLLLEPIKEGEADIVFSRFNRHPLEAPVSVLFACPVLTAIYSHPIHRVVGSQWGISHDFIRQYLKATDLLWNEETGGYGIDGSIATDAIVNNFRICEANLGIKIHHPSGAKRELVFRQVANTLFSRIIADKEWWKEKTGTHQFPLTRPGASFGTRKPHQPEEVDIDSQQAIIKYKDGFNKFYPLYKGIFTPETYQQLEELTQTEDSNFDFNSDLWVRIIYQMILAYTFGKRFTKADVIDSLVPLFNGFTANFALHLKSMDRDLEFLPAEKKERMLSLESEKKLEELAADFNRHKPDFLNSWELSAEAIRPSVPQITYREFIPGAPLIVPTELISPEGTLVRANEIYNRIFTRQKEEFDRFIYERLKVPREASSMEISKAIKDLMKSIEEEILPGINLSTLKGTQKMVDLIFHYFPQREGFALIPEMASRFLAYYPPLNLITKFGCNTLDELLTKHDSLDILALSSWAEGHDYVQKMWQLIAEDLRPEHFTLQPIKPLVVRHQDFPSLVEMRDPSALDKLTSRVGVSTLHKGMGGEFPKLRYLTTVGKNIVEAERFSEIWEKFAKGRKDFGRKVIDSLRNHWGRDPLSAHNIFEDGHHRILRERMGSIAEQVAREEKGRDEARITRYQYLKELAECYHLALIMPDGEFVTCSAWSWASYSFRGGKKSPPPLSAHVERDWASREFLIEYYKAIGGREEEVEKQIFELIEQGREWENLAPILLGREKGIEEVLPKENTIAAPEQSPARELKRYEGNPILKPLKEHPWESKYVFNAGVIRMNRKIYLVYRAFGEDEISRIGLAVSEDGLNFTERLEEPIFEPKTSSEKMGCEDPRLTLMGDRIYMAYTAYDGLIAQIALASIKVKDFLSYHWAGWQRHGLVFPGFDDKDAAIFPEQFNGKFAMLHRVDPHMWITFSPHMRCPWPRREHKILAGTSTGMMWDGRKIGAGAQPLKTRYGWLLITHGVDFAHVYRLGVMLLDLSDPSKLIYRSPNHVLEPVEKWELGISNESWVPNVVFTCGAVPRGEKHLFFLEAEDELLIYYGASDSVIGVAIAKVGDLIPSQFRKGK